MTACYEQHCLFWKKYHRNFVQTFETQNALVDSWREPRDTHLSDFSAAEVLQGGRTGLCSHEPHAASRSR